MTAKLIKGTEIREVILEEVKSGVEQIKEKHGVVPGLVTILVGATPCFSLGVVTATIVAAAVMVPVNIPWQTLSAIS